LNYDGYFYATKFFGDGSGLTGAGATLSDDTTTNADFYLGLSSTTTGAWTSAKVSSTKLTFNPSTGNLNAVTFDGLTLNAGTTGFSIAGGTASKTLTLSNTLTLSGLDGSALNIGGGGILGSAAYVDADSIVTESVNGGLWACGYNWYGQLGNGSSNNQYNSPIQIGLLTNWKQVACGQHHTVGIKTDGTLWASGINTFGQLGNNTRTQYNSPIQVGSLTNWKQVDGGQHHTAAIKTDGTLWTCGYNILGQLGNDTITHYSSPIQVGSLTNWKQVAGGFKHTAAVKTDSSLWTWGNNIWGQLGNGTITHYSSPIQVGSLTNWKQVACGYRHTTAIKTDGSLWSWGWNIYGQLGNGNSTSYSSPIQVGSLTNWKQVAAGYRHTAAIKTDGTLWTCGYNFNGQLGNGTSGNSYSSPIQVGSLTNWKQAACGEYYTVAIKTDGSLWSWGYNNVGQLGNGNVINYSSPIRVGSLTNWKQVACGYRHTVTIPQEYNPVNTGTPLLPMQLGTGTANSTTYLRGDSTWQTISAGATITNDTTTNASYYLGMSSTNTGSWTTAYTSDTKLFFNPSTGTLNSTNFYSLSDVTKKKNVVTISDATNTIGRLRGVEFDWVDYEGKSSGIIAQELEKVIPRLVDGVDIKTVNYSGLLGYVIEAIKELDNRLKAVEV
jgi:alpha-tubulin suppressor-like RCC1 family protein